jgi:extracellular elastinolytic metalloproteinase
MGTAGDRAAGCARSALQPVAARCDAGPAVPSTVRSQPPGVPPANRRPRRTAATALALALAALGPASAALAAWPPTRPAAGSPADRVVDVRAAVAARAERTGRPLRAPSSAARSARARLARALGPQAVVDVDPITGTPRMVGRLNGALTPPRPGDAIDAATAWIRRHLEVLGLTADDVGSLRPADRTTSPGGVEHLRFQQMYDGIPAYDNDLRVTVDRRGRVVSVAGAPVHGLRVPSTQPTLDAAVALRALAASVGAATAATVRNTAPGPRRATTFADGSTADLVLFTGTDVRLAWSLTFPAGSDAWYAAVVDATTGEVLRRENLVKGLTASVWGRYPGAPAGGAAGPFLLDPYLSPAATELSGPNALVYSDVNDNDREDAGEAVSPNDYAFTPSPVQCGPVRCSWDPATANSWAVNRQQNATQIFATVNAYHDHLAAAPIGFSLPAGERVVVNSDDGANTATGLPDAEHVNNADMTVPPAGKGNPLMQMYLFSSKADPTARDINGGDDAAVVLHEYTHALSSRLVTTATGAAALSNPQAAAMGEGWSDWYAMDYLVARGAQVDTDAPGEVDMGAYTDATPHTIRSEGLDCPVGSASAACPAGGYTYADFGKLVVVNGAPVAEPHSDGEIWGQTLWDLRRALGSAVTEALVTDAMRLSPPEPSFIDERNAILQADTARYQDAHKAAIWQVFAARGMGVNASGSGPTADFTTPPPDAPPPPPPPPASSAPPPAAAAADPAPAAPAASAVTAPAVAPRLALSARGTRARVAVGVTCAVRCTVTARLTASKRLARRLGLGRKTTLGARRVQARPGTRRLSVALSRRVVAAMRRAGLRRVTATLTVRSTDAAGRKTSAARKVTVRR